MVSFQWRNTMSIPSNNLGFREGNFSGYGILGRCAVVDKLCYQSPFQARTIEIKPVGGGKFFAVLDPNNSKTVDNNGARRPSSNNLNSPVNTTAYHFQDDFTGMTTFGIDGAILEIPNVSIKQGDMLRFRWQFLGYDTIAGNLNDFALFDACHGNQANPPKPCYRKVLAHALDLSGTRNTGWINWTWIPDHDFTGLLRWVVSNGVVSGNSPTAITSSMKARPSSLLIDMIKIESA